MIKILTHYTIDWLPLALVTVPVMKEYCEAHGYELSVLPLSGYEKGRYTGIEKVQHILDEYKTGDTLLVLDVDCLITNHLTKIEDLCDAEQPLYFDTDINGINTGVILQQCTNATLNSFWGIIKTALQRNRYYCEQDAINDLLSDKQYFPNGFVSKSNKISFIPYPYYSPSFGKIGYKEGDEVPMPTHEQGNWQMGDFICHLPGKTMQERIDIFKKMPIVK